MSGNEKRPVDVGRILETIQEKLLEKGLKVDLTGDIEACCSPGGKVKMVCVAPGLGDSVRELGKCLRDQVVMVRVDEATSQALEDWVATGAVRSRSEAAALFIREGLKVRADELERLRGALREVDDARERLRSRAKEVFGDRTPESDAGA